jgi:Zn-dependent protease/CBS domain-containing protein
VLIGRITGIPVRIDWSWILVFALFVVMLSQTTGPFGTIAPAERALVAAATVLLLFLCVLLHETSHALVARLYGIQTRDITLFAFGGVSHLETTGVTPAQQAQIAAAGPLASFVIAGIAVAVAEVTSGVGAQVAAYLGIVNLALGIFNLLPSYPLDGGRVLHALVWRIRGDRIAATRFMASFSSVVGALLMGLAVLLFFIGDFIGGIWIALIAWFVMASARSEYTAELLAGPLSHTATGDIMDAPGETVAPDESCEQTLQTLLRTRRRVAAVTDNGVLEGIAVVSDFGKIHERDPATVRISEIMTPYERVIAVLPGTTALDALRRLAESGHAQLPVVDERRVLRGFVTRETAIRVMRFTASADVGSPTPFRPRT